MSDNRISKPTRRFFLKGMGSAAASSMMPQSILSLLPTGIPALAIAPKEAIIQLVGLAGGLSHCLNPEFPEAIRRWGGMSPIESLAGEADFFNVFSGEKDLTDETLADRFGELRMSIGMSSEFSPEALESPEALHAAIKHYTQLYSNGYEQIERIGQAIQSDPVSFGKAAVALSKEYPSIFPAGTSEDYRQMPLSELVDMLSGIGDGTWMPPCNGSQVSGWMWESFGKLTGIVPPEATPEVRAEIERFTSRPGYRPFVSREARLERVQAEVKKLACTVRERQEELPLYYAGDYDTSQSTRSALVYLLHDPAKTMTDTRKLAFIKPQPVLQKLADAINGAFPLEPAISTAFVHQDSMRAEMRGDYLRIIEPPAALKTWLDDLAQRKTTHAKGAKGPLGFFSR